MFLTLSIQCLCPGTWVFFPFCFLCVDFGYVTAEVPPQLSAFLNTVVCHRSDLLQKRLESVCAPGTYASYCFRLLEQLALVYDDHGGK